MPMIDVYAPADMFSEEAGRCLASDLTQAVLAAEGFPDPAPVNVQHVTGFYIHRLPSSDVHTARTGSARTVRVDVIAAAGGLTSAAKKVIIEAATEIVARHALDKNQTNRTFVVVHEAAPGGWGIAGKTFSKDNVADFHALDMS
ncbi:tautomerase family protein [Sphingomonas sp. OK281]|uniref:tautomerase family protein n=1 Tax=Sphingomonas sp. OK281 TaxID=1881067 RepID=UPI0008F4523B|nr:tautomerase family protein [Sphingomonas sp. OK281]SFO48915.1 Phenylpyruvate tautomerase PptA, 4-oxalocrotonate tautomerase family [Sphingomonas sp. OK281]